MNRTASQRRQSLGFTLVELCVGLGVCATIVSQAVPAMNRMKQEQRLRGAAAALAADLHLARSEAVRTNDTVYFRISGKGSEACYVLHTGAEGECDCAGGTTTCQSANSQVLRAEWLPAGQSLHLSSNVETMRFEHQRGLVTPTGSVELSAGEGMAIRHVVAITGRVRSCSAGADKISGMAKCV
jgi:Tfp pilus assembly protein FimT